MKNVITLVILATLGTALPVTAAAQYTISIPKIPKISKDKPAQTPVPSSKSGSDSSNASKPTSESSSQQKHTDSEDPDNLDWSDVASPAYLSHRDTVNEVLKQVRAYKPGSGGRIVSGSGYEYDWFNASISSKLRAEKMKSWTNLQPQYRRWFDAKLDEIGKIATEKLSSYLPAANAFPVRNPAEERLMKGALSEMQGVTVHRIGLQSATWTIDKNELGIPKNRFKYGAVYGKNPNADDPFCEVWYVNIIQDYAGGGTWGSSYARWVKSETFGCPQITK